VGLAVSRMLRDGAVTGPGQDAGASALPAVLGELADLFGCPAAVAFRQDAGEDPVVLAAHPGDAADQALLAQLSTMATDQGGPPGGDGYAEGAVTFGGRPASARLAYAGQDAGRSPTSVALLGEPARFGLECQATLLAIATIVAAQARHASVTARAGRRARPREARRESENRFRALAQLAPVGIVMADTGGMYTFANVRWCELTGMTTAQALRARWPAGIHPDDAGRLVRDWEQAAAAGRELSTDCRLRSAGGRQVWARLSLTPVPGADGRPSGFLAAVTDVSDRKRAEQDKERLLRAERAARRSLADQTGRLNSLIAAAIPGVLVSDENGLITQINKSFCDLFGIGERSEKFVGTPVAEMVRRIREVFADPGEFARRTGRAFTARRPVDGEQFACADGRTFEFDYWPVFVHAAYRGDLWLVWDMSERTALAEQRERMLEAEAAAREAAEQARARLAEQNARLRDLDEAKTQFISTMSHELRTPLTSIISFTELIMDGEQQLTGETVSSLSVIQRNAERLLGLIGDLLLLSRIEHGTVLLDRSVIDIPGLVADAARAGSANAAEHGITVDVSAAAGPPLFADPLRLRQVLCNLLSNAIKFTGRGGTIRVSAGYDGEQWQIDVADNGMGVPADELGSLFDRFFRASNARIAGLPGVGLGLAVVKAVTELHGGSVRARSLAGQGSMFSVCLPAHPHEQPVPAPVTSQVPS